MQKKISESSGFNLLGVYLTFAFGILNTFIIARLLAPQEWALIILTFSVINIMIFFCNVFPPNAQDSIKYYIPHLSIDNVKENEIIKRSFIIHVFKIRLLSTFIILTIYLIIIRFFNFKIPLINIIYIMAPIILLNIITTLNSSILLAFKKFKLVFTILLLNPLIVVISNISLFLLQLENPIFFIAFNYLLGSLIACLLSLIIVLPIIPKKIKELNYSKSFKKDFIEIHKKYGSYLIIANLFNLLSGLIINLIFFNFGHIEYITYLTICQISVSSALYFSSSNPNSYISIFSEISYEKNSEYFNKLFYKLLIFLTLLNCFIVAIMLFYIELYIVVIYSEIYLIILFPIQLFLFTSFAKVIIRNLTILTNSTNNTKIDAIVSFGEMLLTIIFSIVAIVYFSFYVLIIFYIFISFIMALFMFYLTKRSIIFNRNLLAFFKPFLLFIVCFFITFFISTFFYIQISNKAYINFILNGTVKFCIFLLLFYLTLYFTKLITKEDFEQLIEIIPVLNSNKKFIKFILKIIKKILPSTKKKSTKDSF